jgi:hypothetical protein
MRGVEVWLCADGMAEMCMYSACMTAASDQRLIRLERGMVSDANSALSCFNIPWSQISRAERLRCTSILVAGLSPMFAVSRLEPLEISVRSPEDSAHQIGSTVRLLLKTEEAP